MKPETEINRLPRYLLAIPWDLSFVGGVSEVVRNLYREFQEQDIADPSVLVPCWECRKLSQQTLDGRTSLNLRMPAPPLPGKDFPKRCASFIVGGPGALLQLYNLIRQNRIQIVNPHYPGPYLFHFAILKRLFPRLFSFTISMHGSDVIAMEKQEPHTATVRWILGSADHVTVPSLSLAVKLRNTAPETAAKTICIYNGVARGKFHWGTGQGDSRIPQRPYIIHVGSFERIKGQDVLLEAFSRIRRVHPNISLLLVGRSGSFLPEIQRMIAELEISDVVMVMKDIAPEEIPRLLSGAALVALPSRYEGGVPLVLLEAGAVKKPVVASNAGGIAELITGKNGLLVPPEDPVALARAMLNLLENPRLAQEMGSTLYRTVSGSFSWETTARRYLELTMA